MAAAQLSSITSSSEASRVQRPAASSASEPGQPGGQVGRGRAAAAGSAAAAILAAARCQRGGGVLAGRAAAAAAAVTSAIRCRRRPAAGPARRPGVTAAAARSRSRSAPDVSTSRPWAGRPATARADRCSACRAAGPACPRAAARFPVRASSASEAASGVTRPSSAPAASSRPAISFHTCSAAETTSVIAGESTPHPGHRRGQGQFLAARVGQVAAGQRRGPGGQLDGRPGEQGGDLGQFPGPRCPAPPRRLGRPRPSRQRRSAIGWPGRPRPRPSAAWSRRSARRPPAAACRSCCPARAGWPGWRRARRPPPYHGRRLLPGQHRDGHRYSARRRDRPHAQPTAMTRAARDDAGLKAAERAEPAAAFEAKTAWSASMRPQVGLELAEQRARGARPGPYLQLGLGAVIGCGVQLLRALVDREPGGRGVPDHQAGPDEPELTRRGGGPQEPEPASRPRCGLFPRAAPARCGRPARRATGDRGAHRRPAMHAPVIGTDAP